MNRFECIGRLTKDPEISTLNNGSKIAKFSIAVDRKFKDEDGNDITDFFNCIAWNKIGEVVSKYTKKGSKLYVAGRLQNRCWQDEDGKKKYTTELNVLEMDFLENKPANAEDIKADLKPVDDGDLPF